jgi:hypothetical protein
MEELGIIASEIILIYLEKMGIAELDDTRALMTNFSKKSRCSGDYKEIAPGEFAVWVE